MKRKRWFVVGLLILSMISKDSGSAQETATIASSSSLDLAPVQSVQPDTIVQLTAEAQGLALVPPDQVPFFGTFWMVMPGSGASLAPLPCPPPDPSLPTYAMAPGQFLVDGTANAGN